MMMYMYASCADQNIGERINIKGEVSLSNYCMPFLSYDLNLNKESMEVISAYWTKSYHFVPTFHTISYPHFVILF